VAEFTTEDNLVRKLVLETGFQIGVVKAVLNAHARFSIVRLLVERKPVNYGFFKITALPYRDNWKQIMLSKHPDILVRLRGEDEEGRMKILEESGFIEDLNNSDLISWDDKEQIVGWTLDVLPEKSFENASKALEVEKKNSTTSPEYVQAWANTIASFAKIRIKAFLSWAKKTTRPIATILPCGRSGYSYKFSTYIPKGRVTPSYSPDMEGRDVFAVYPETLSTSPNPVGNKANLRGAIEDVLEVSGL
jgi:hypothetical protein